MEIESASAPAGTAGPVLLLELDEAGAVGAVQAGVLHDCEAAPLQVAPPLEGAGFVQVRV